MHRDKKWIMWSLLLPTYFISFFHRTALSPIGNIILNDLNIVENRATILGILTSIYFFTYSIMQFPSGFLADTIGPKKIVGLGGILMGAGTLLFAYTNSLYVLYVARFIIGFGASFNFLSLLRMQSNWFTEKEFPLLTGLTIFIGNLGALFGLGPFSILIDIFGLKTNLILFSLIPIIFGFIVLIFVKDYPDDFEYKNGDLSFFKTFKEVLRIKNNYLTLFAFSFSNGVYITFVSFCNIPFLMNTYNLSKTDASSLTTIITFGAVIGCLMNSLMVKIFKLPKKAGIFLLSIAMIFWIVISVIKLDASHLWLYIFIYFFFGFALSGLNLIFTNVKFNNSHNITASALAFTNFGAFIAIALFQYLSGVILDFFSFKDTVSMKTVYPDYSFRILFFLLSFFHFLSIVFYFFTKAEKNFSRTTL